MDKDKSKIELSEIRKEIDRINLEIALHMEKRFQLLDQIATIKAKSNTPIYDEQREQEMLEQLSLTLKDKKHETVILKAMAQLFKTSLNYLKSKMD